MKPLPPIATESVTVNSSSSTRICGICDQRCSSLRHLAKHLYLRHIKDGPKDNYAKYLDLKAELARSNAKESKEVGKDNTNDNRKLSGKERKFMKITKNCSVYLESRKKKKQALQKKRISNPNLSSTKVANKQSRASKGHLTEQLNRDVMVLWQDKYLQSLLWIYKHMDDLYVVYLGNIKHYGLDKNNCCKTKQAAIKLFGGHFVCRHCWVIKASYEAMKQHQDTAHGRYRRYDNNVVRPDIATPAVENNSISNNNNNNNNFKSGSNRKHSKKSKRGNGSNKRQNEGKEEKKQKGKKKARKSSKNGCKNNNNNNDKRDGSGSSGAGSGSGSGLSKMGIMRGFESSSKSNKNSKNGGKSGSGGSSSTKWSMTLTEDEFDASVATVDYVIGFILFVCMFLVHISNYSNLFCMCFVFTFCFCFLFFILIVFGCLLNESGEKYSVYTFPNIIKK